MDHKRREALKKLAMLSAYSAPAVTTLLTPQLSYAQTSAAFNDPQNAPFANFCNNNNLLTNLPPQFGGIDAGFFSGNQEHDCSQ